MRGAAIFLRGLGADLPGAVHFIAKAPEFDVMRLFIAMRAAEIGELGAARMIAIFDEPARLIEPACAQIDAEHRLNADLARPIDEFICSKGVGLGREPRQIEAARAFGERTNAVLPIVAREKIAAGIAHDRDAKLLRQIGDVLAKPLRVGGGMAGLEYAGVDAPAHMFDERSKDAAVDVRNGKVAINNQAG